MFLSAYPPGTSSCSTSTSSSSAGGLIDHLRAKAGGPLPPVVFYSAEDDATLARLAEESGVDGYVSKGSATPSS